MSPRGARSNQGQILAITALSLVAVIAMVALVVEGGNVFAQQRISQNASDAAATAGTLVVAEELARRSIDDDPTDPNARTNHDVLVEIQSSAAANKVVVDDAEYTDAYGTPIGVQVEDDADLVPQTAAGVRVATSRSAGTTLARVIGIDQLMASSEATVVAGPLIGCPEGEPCAVLPVTFPVAVSECEGNSLVGIGTGIDTNGDGVADGPAWPIIDSGFDATNRAVVPLCGTGSGSVGWLDLEDGKNLAEEITDPGNEAFDVPTWLITQTGNMNNVESALNSLYSGKIVLIPLFDGYCREEPTGTQLTDCPNPDVVGANTWYHVPKFTAFLLDEAYVQGNDSAACIAAEGSPHIIADWSGFESCFAGWFTKYITSGPIAPGQTIEAGDVVGVRLVK